MVVLLQSVSLSLVDDQPMVMSGLNQLFAARSDFTVVSEGNTAPDIVGLARKSNPDVIIVEIGVPGSALEAIAEVSSMDHPPKILVYTAIRDVSIAMQAIEAGAVGYILKSRPVSELIKGLREVSQGEVFITSSFAMKIAASIQKKPRLSDMPLEFSSREEQVLKQLLRGLTNKEIAEALDISEKTVKQYMTVIIQKMNVRNRVEVALAAREMMSNQAE